MPLLSLPNELLLDVSQYQSLSDIHSLLLTNRRLSQLLKPVLHNTLFSTRSCIDGRRALLHAASHGDTATVRALLARGILEFTEKGGILQHALKVSKNDDLVCVLISCGVPPDKADSSYSTLLTRAVEAGSVKVVRFLIGRGDVDVNVKSYNPNVQLGWETPLLAAVSSGNVEMVRILLEDSRTDVNLAHLRYTPLSLVACNGNVAVFRLLMQDPRVDVNMFDSSGGNPLLNGARSGEISIVRELLTDPRVDVNAVGCNLESAIHTAARRRHPHILRLLVEDGRIDVNAPNGYGFTPLELAINGSWSGEFRDQAVREECVRCILSHKSFDPSTKNRWNGTVLQVAMSFPTPGISRILLAEGRFDAEAVNNAALKLLFSESPIKGECLQDLLRDPRLNANYRNGRGETILHCAARSDSMGMMWDLLEDGRFDVNAVDNNMATPLHVAAHRMTGGPAWLLLTKRSGGEVDVALKNCNGDTALDVAVKGGFQEATRVLQGQEPVDKDDIIRCVNEESCLLPV